MKKKLFSLWLVLSLGFTALFPCATEISFEEMDIDSMIIDSPIEATEENYTDNKVSSINLLSDNNDADIPEMAIPDNLTYTPVDLTDLATGDIVTHDCNMYLVTNFDEDSHWNECTVCGKIIDLEEHDYQDNGWTMGNANNCSEANVHKFICNCGISYDNIDGRKAHSLQTNSVISSREYAYQCPVCAYYETIHKCVKSDGTRIDCNNPGKCALCGYTYTAYHVAYDSLTSGEMRCNICNRYLGYANVINHVYNAVGDITINYSFSVNGSYSSVVAAPYNPNVGISVTDSGNGVSGTMRVYVNQHYESSFYIGRSYNYTQNGVRCKVAVGQHLKPEIIPPVIDNILLNSNDWTTNSESLISDTENYCNSVNITLKDTDDNIYLKNIKATVNNGEWNYSIKPNIETKDNKEFILVVSDSLGNTTEQNFYISKIDTIPPRLISDEKTSTEWSKTKDYVITTTDGGIGQVQNSVVNADNYEFATESGDAFYKGYTFTGDVYGDAYVPVYSKDGLNNISTEFIKVSNLDNTSPTIENIDISKELHNTSITISANDINNKLNASGSGVTGYAITKENIQPTEFQESNTFIIAEHGNYYIWVTDLVGNVACKETYIPVQYKMTINPNGGIWQGDTEPKEYIIDSDKPINLYPAPEKEGHTFKEWDITGNGELDGDGNLTVNGDVKITPIWETNTYSVIYIDYDVTNDKELGRVVKNIDFGTEVRGFDMGNDMTDNTYYNQYRLTTDTTDIVKMNDNIIYRYFEFCYTEKQAHIDFNDNDNADDLRPDTYKLQLILQDGTVVKEVTLSSDVTDYTFELLPKYDEQGKEYIYKVNPVISDRYIITIPEDGEPEISYFQPAYNVIIPKLTTLNGKNGDLSYNIQIHSDLFYNDKIIIIPDENITLTDGITNLNATVNQNKTIFTKEDITNNKLNVAGDIQVNKKYFAGIWTGTFNFKIKYEVQN